MNTASKEANTLFLKVLEADANAFEEPEYVVRMHLTGEEAKEMLETFAGQLSERLGRLAGRLAACTTVELTEREYADKRRNFEFKGKQGA